MKTSLRRAAQVFTLRRTILVFAASMQLATMMSAQIIKSREQSHFDIEQGDVGIPIRRPAALPKAALEVLRNDRWVLNCAKNQHISASQIPANWFIASEIHLDGPVEGDFVVLPRFDLDLKPSNLCLMGANIGPFWILTRTPKGYALVLDISAHDLDVLDRRTKGYRDIRISSTTATMENTAILKFDGHKYRVYRSSEKPIQ